MAVKISGSVLDFSMNSSAQYRLVSISIPAGLSLAHVILVDYSVL